MTVEAAGAVPDDVIEEGAHAAQTHELKTWPEFFTAIEIGAKTFEVRFDDRGMEAGDTLVLREWDPSVCCYTGKSLTVLVTYRLVLADAPGLRWVGASGKAGEPGEWVVLGLSVPSVAEVFARDAKVQELRADVIRWRSEEFDPDLDCEMDDRERGACEALDAVIAAFDDFYSVSGTP